MLRCLDKKKIISFFLLINFFLVRGQDYQFSQFNKAPLLINPANAGMGKGYNRFNLIYQTQHPASGFVFQDYHFSADGPIFSHKMKASKGFIGLGFHAYQERSANSFTKLDIGITLSTYVDLDDNNQLSFGFQTDFIQHTINTNNIQWASQYNGNIGGYDPTINSGELFSNNSLINFNTGTGLLFKNKTKSQNLSGIDVASFQIGYAAFNLFRPTKISLLPNDRYFVRHVFHGRSLFAVRELKYGIAPQFLIQKQGPHFDATLGADIKYYVKGDTKYTGFVRECNLGIGLFYRYNDAVITKFSIQFNDLNISLAYDLSVGELSKYNGTVGGFSIGIQLNDTYGVLFNQGNMHVVNRSRRMRNL
jgi:type IX secretion system PorP/SprF family membrane protein